MSRAFTGEDREKIEKLRDGACATSDWRLRGLCSAALCGEEPARSICLSAIDQALAECGVEDAETFGVERAEADGGRYDFWFVDHTSDLGEYLGRWPTYEELSVARRAYTLRSRKL